MQFPVGYRFHPTDSELVGFYLYNKIFQPSLLSGNTSVIDFDLYGSLEPSDIWTLFGGDSLLEDDPSLFFFTNLKKKSSKGRRVCRTVASGTWAGEDGGETVLFGTVVGFKKRFRYENPSSPQDRAWIMHEFSLDSHHTVVCRLKRNKSAAGGRRGVHGDRKRKSKSTVTAEEDSEVSVENVEPKRPRIEHCPIVIDENEPAHSLSSVQPQGEVFVDKEQEEAIMKLFEDLPSLEDASDSFADAIPGDVEQNTADSSHSAIIPVAKDGIAGNIHSWWAEFISLDDLTDLQCFDVPFPTQPTPLLEANR